MTALADRAASAATHPDGATAVPPETVAFYPALDGVRAVGALLVVITHCAFRSGQSLQGSFWSHLTSRFTFGVALFFVLSGFLLYRPFAAVANGAPRPNVRRYLRRRAARILPPLWAFVIIMLTWVEKPRVKAETYLSFLTLTHMFNGNDLLSDMRHLWSLSAEVSFYLLLPVFGLVLVGRSPRASGSFGRQVIGIGAIIASTYVYLLLWGFGVLTHPQATTWVFANLSWFGAGMLLAALATAGPQWVSRYRAGRALVAWAQSLGLCWAMATTVFLLSTLPFGKPYDLAPARTSQLIWENLLFGIAAFFYLLPLVLGTHPRADRVLGGKVGRYLGDISYSVYLWHVPLILVAEAWTGSGLFQGHFLRTFAVTLVLSIVVASASWFLIERPAMRYLSGRRPRTKAAKQEMVSAP